MILVSWSGTIIPDENVKNRVYIQACSFKLGDKCASPEKTFYLSIYYHHDTNFCEISKSRKLYQDSVGSYVYMEDLVNGRYALNATKGDLSANLEFIKKDDKVLYLNLFLQ
jgi:hypothetical protein